MSKEIKKGCWVQMPYSGNIYVITVIEWGQGGQVFGRDVNTGCCMAIGNNTEKFTVI